MRARGDMAVGPDHAVMVDARPRVDDRALTYLSEGSDDRSMEYGGARADLCGSGHLCGVGHQSMYGESQLHSAAGAALSGLGVAQRDEDATMAPREQIRKLIVGAKVRDLTHL